MTSFNVRSFFLYWNANHGKIKTLSLDGSELCVCQQYIFAFYGKTFIVLMALIAAFF